VSNEVKEFKGFKGSKEFKGFKEFELLRTRARQILQGD
jgi:hypothetical protein